MRRITFVLTIALAGLFSAGVPAQDDPDDRAEYAVDRALEWLARHQHEHGYWDSDGFEKSCNDGRRCRGKGYPTYDVGLTGLSLLAFLGSGYTHRKGKYKKVVAGAVKFLRRVQDPKGCFGVRSGHFMYNHAAAMLAMTEAYRLTSSPVLKRPVEAALKFLYEAQNPSPWGQDKKLGWRYTVQPGDNDSSVTSWCVIAMVSAHRAGIEVDRDALEGARDWLKRMTVENGRVGYVQKGVSPVRGAGREEKWPRKLSEAITAISIVSRDSIASVLGEEKGHAATLAKSGALCLERLPMWEETTGQIDHYYWLWGTLAMHRLGGDSWKAWGAALKKAVGENQRMEGCERGSWDPLGAWGQDGGRIYATAMNAMCMQLYYRYAHVFGTR